MSVVFFLTQLESVIAFMLLFEAMKHNFSVFHQHNIAR